jgi:hypothetical protein
VKHVPLVAAEADQQLHIRLLARRMIR